MLVAAVISHVLAILANCNRFITDTANQLGMSSLLLLRLSVMSASVSCVRLSGAALAVDPTPPSLLPGRVPPTLVYVQFFRTLQIEYYIMQNSATKSTEISVLSPMYTYLCQITPYPDMPKEVYRTVYGNQTIRRSWENRLAMPPEHGFSQYRIWIAFDRFLCRFCVDKRLRIEIVKDLRARTICVWIWLQWTEKERQQSILWSGVECLYLWRNAQSLLMYPDMCLLCTLICSLCVL